MRLRDCGDRGWVCSQALLKCVFVFRSALTRQELARFTSEAMDEEVLLGDITRLLWGSRKHVLVVIVDNAWKIIDEWELLKVSDIPTCLAVGPTSTH